MAADDSTEAPIQMLRTVQALMPEPARAVFEAAIERHERWVARPHAEDPKPPQEKLERLAVGIHAGDSGALTEFANYLRELGLADQLAGHIVYLVLLTLSEETREKLLEGGAKVIPFPRPER